MNEIQNRIQELMNLYEIKETSDNTFSILKNWEVISYNLKFELNQNEFKDLLNQTIQFLVNKNNSLHIKDQELIYSLILLYKEKNKEDDDFLSDLNELIEDVDSEDKLTDEYKTKLFEIMNEIENWNLWREENKIFYKVMVWDLINQIIQNSENQEHFQKWVDELYQEIQDFKESWFEEYLQYINHKINFINLE